MKPALGDGEGGIADGAAPVSLDDAGRTQSTTKGGSVGSPMEVLKVVVRALRSVVGETRMLFEHRNSANFHMLCPDIIVDSCTAVRIREKQLAVLTSEFPETDRGDIVDERVLTSNGLRLLGL